MATSAQYDAMGLAGRLLYKVQERSAWLQRPVHARVADCIEREIPYLDEATKLSLSIFVQLVSSRLSAAESLRPDTIDAFLHIAEQAQASADSREYAKSAVALWNWYARCDGSVDGSLVSIVAFIERFLEIEYTTLGHYTGMYCTLSRSDAQELATGSARYIECFLLVSQYAAHYTFVRGAAEHNLPAERCGELWHTLCLLPAHDYALTASLLPTYDGEYGDLLSVIAGLLA